MRKFIKELRFIWEYIKYRCVTFLSPENTGVQQQQEKPQWIVIPSDNAIPIGLGLLEDQWLLPIRWESPEAFILEYLQDSERVSNFYFSEGEPVWLVNLSNGQCVSFQSVLEQYLPQGVTLRDHFNGS